MSPSSSSTCVKSREASAASPVRIACPLPWLPGCASTSAPACAAMPPVPSDDPSSTTSTCCDGAAQAGDDAGDGARFVEGGDQGGGPECRGHGTASRPACPGAGVIRPLRAGSTAGSTSSEAAASVTTVTSETMPIERSGG